MRVTVSTDDLLRAIRRKCMDCSGNQRTLVEGCMIRECPLFPYRSIKSMGGESARAVYIKGQISMIEIMGIPKKSARRGGEDA